MLPNTGGKKKNLIQDDDVPMTLQPSWSVLDNLKDQLGEKAKAFGHEESCDFNEDGFFHDGKLSIG